MGLTKEVCERVERWLGSTGLWDGVDGMSRRDLEAFDSGAHLARCAPCVADESYIGRGEEEEEEEEDDDDGIFPDESASQVGEEEEEESEDDVDGDGKLRDLLTDPEESDSEVSSGVSR